MTKLHKEKKQTEKFSFHENVNFADKTRHEHFLMFFGKGDKNGKLGNGLKLSVLLWMIFLQVGMSQG